MATYAVKPSDVYTRKPEIPEGWVYDGFRFAEVGEHYLNGDKTWVGQPVTIPVTVQQALTKHICPQIIVKKAGPPLETSLWHTYTVSVSDIYGEPFPPIPKGWVRADFRFPQHGETYLPTVATLLPRILVSQWDKSRGPRIILEPAPPQANKKRRQEEHAEDWWE